MFTLTIETDNAAFDGEQALRLELERILCVVLARLNQGDDEGQLFDANGNSVGSFNLER